MRLPVQVLGIPVIASACGAVGFAIASAGAEMALDVCDPKFGCSFGLEFGAVMSAIVAFVAAIAFVCALVGYTAATGRLIRQRTTLLGAALLGLIVGSSWAVMATISYARS